MCAFMHTPPHSQETGKKAIFAVKWQESLGSLASKSSLLVKVQTKQETCLKTKMDLRNNIQAVLLPLNLYTERYIHRNIHSQVENIVAKVIFLFFFFWDMFSPLFSSTLESHRSGWPQTQRSACPRAQSNLPLNIITWSLKNTYAYKMFSLPFLQWRVQSHPPQQPV